MSAGNGVQHSEFNPSSSEPVHLLQIWLQPNNPGGEPRYHDYNLLAHAAGRPLTLITSSDGRDHSIATRADGEIYFGHLTPGQELTPAAGFKKSWLHLISGEILLDKTSLLPGDGLAIDGPLPDLQASQDSTFLLFNL